MKPNMKIKTTKYALQIIESLKKFGSHSTFCKLCRTQHFFSHKNNTISKKHPLYYEQFEFRISWCCDYIIYMISIKIKEYLLVNVIYNYQN